VGDVGPFNPAERPVRYTPSSLYWGPDHNDPCPCESTKRAGDCHVNRAKGNWKLPTYAPLLTDPKTGVSCAGCYASFTNDCLSKLSNEHWLSEGILLHVGQSGRVLISGLRWQQGQQHALSAKSLGSNILCEHHNRALSRLDATAIAVFKTLDHYQIDFRTQPDPHGSEFDLYSGEELERWLLKLLWGGAAAGVLGRGGQPVNDLRTTADRNMLAEYLFRDGSLPRGWGLYVSAQTDVDLRTEADVAVATGSGPDGAIWQGVVAMGVVAFTFALGNLRAHSGFKAFYRPRGVCLDSRLDPARKVLALGWNHNKSTSQPVTYTKRVN
jgi:hypothetical protein